MKKEEITATGERNVERKKYWGNAELKGEACSGGEGG